MVVRHELGADTGAAASDDEVSRYMRSLREAVSAKYKLLRKAFSIYAALAPQRMPRVPAV
jgi:hypothetical protein